MKITFLPEKTTVNVDSSSTILDAAAVAGINIKSVCGGGGTCGKCQVVLPTGETVLACQTKVTEELTVTIPHESRLLKHQVLLDNKDQENRGEVPSRGVVLNPLCYSIDLQIKPPNLDDNLGDLTRFEESLKKAGKIEKPVLIELEQINTLAALLRESNWQVSAYLLDMGEYVRLIHLEDQQQKTEKYGLAIDIGTTTVAAFLVNLATGEVIDRAGSYNLQAQFGDDVISRIVYATEQKDGLRILRNSVVKTINKLIDDLVLRNNLSKEQILIAMSAGNTTMVHLFLGIDPKYIRLEPYIPVVNQVPPIMAEKLQLDIKTDGYVFNFPSVASYVGGDIVAGVLYTNMAKEAPLTLFVDIGTNGEMVLGNQDWLVTCACSAGPAFEGGGITYGMRAMTGAIEKVEIHPSTLEVSTKVIGNAEAIGICGSGLIDCIAQLRKTKIIDRTGKIIMEDHPRVRVRENEREFVLAYNSGTDSKDIVITEDDIKNLIRSKGAVYAGIMTMLKMVDLELEAIERVIIAGGFGNYLNIDDAIEIGLLPDLPRERYSFWGNTSVNGARSAMLSQNAWQEALEISKGMTYLELSIGNTFMDEYVSALFLPHTDISKFPTIGERG